MGITAARSTALKKYRFPFAKIMYITVYENSPLFRLARYFEVLRDCVYGGYCGGGCSAALDSREVVWVNRSPRF